MSERSAGILLYRRTPELEVFIAHMGGPFWARKDAGAWSVPKGVFTDEAPLDAALREFAEEIGSPAPAISYRKLGEVRYSSGKTVVAFAAETDFDPGVVRSNEFTLEWPPRSGRHQSFPEIDRARWAPVDEARRMLIAAQRPLLDLL